MTTTKMRDLTALLMAGFFGEPDELLANIEGLDLDSIQYIVDNVNPFEQLPMGLLGDALFPADRVEELDIKYLKGAGGASVMAGVTSHNAEAPIVPRRGLEKVTGEIPSLKIKLPKGPEDLIRLQNPALQQRLVQSIYDDITTVRRGVIGRVEWLRMQALAYGLATISGEGNLNVTVDFLVPSGHKATLTGTDLWSDTDNSTPLADIEGWVNTMVSDQGVRPARIATGSGPRNAFLAHPSVRKAIYGVNYDRRLRIDEVNEFLAQQDLPQFMPPYDIVVHQLQADGTLGSAVRLFPNDRITLLPPESFGALGSMKEAPTATEATRNVSTGIIAIDGRRIATHIYVATMDPKNLVTLAEASTFPSFENADYVFLAKVL